MIIMFAQTFLLYSDYLSWCLKKCEFLKLSNELSPNNRGWVIIMSFLLNRRIDHSYGVPESYFFSFVIVIVEHIMTAGFIFAYANANRTESA